MLLGIYEPSYLGKGRLALPKKIRNEIVGDRIVLTIGFEPCVFGFDENTWNEVVQPELEKPFFSDESARKMRRKMCVNAIVAQFDKQGRVIIPDKMLAYAGIKSNLTVIGAGDHFEIWEQTAWKTYEKKL